MYNIPSKSVDILRRMINRKIIRMVSATPQELEMYTKDAKPNEMFSHNALQFYVELEDNSTISFVYLGHQHRSIGICLTSHFPTPAEMAEDMHASSPISLYEASDLRYSNSFFKNFINTTITKIEIMDAHDIGLYHKDHNERGIRITNNNKYSFIIGYNLKLKDKPSGLAIIEISNFTDYKKIFTFRDI